MTVDARIAALIPHAGRMCLLERVIRWDDSGVTLATTTHRDPQNPLARDGRLHAIHLCEYGAQAMAVHGGLRAQAGGQRTQPGLLVSLRDVSFNCEHIHNLPGKLLVEAMRVHEGGNAWQYDFRVTCAGRLLAQGRALVSLVSSN